MKFNENCSKALGDMEQTQNSDLDLESAYQDFWKDFAEFISFFLNIP